MKLELKHLAPYLPYDLRYLTSDTRGESWLFAGTPPMIMTMGPVAMISILQSESKYKPLLHPLSRLTEPILEGGDIPIDWLQEKYYTLALDRQCKRVLEDERWINQCDWLLIQHLCEWHIDFQGLIEKGLAEPIKL